MKRFKNAVERTHSALEEEKREMLSSSDGEGNDDDLGARKKRNRRSHFLQDIFGGDEVHVWIDLFVNFPSLQNVSGLHIKLAQSDAEWMERFLEQNGLEAILNMLYSLSYLRFNRLENREKIDLDDAIIMLACINCLKAVMKKNRGLEYFCDGCDPNVTKNVLFSKSFFSSSIFDICQRQFPGYLNLCKIKTIRYPLHGTNLLSADKTEADFLLQKNMFVKKMVWFCLAITILFSGYFSREPYLIIGQRGRFCFHYIR